MASEIELSKQCLAINKIPKNSITSVMRALVIRRGSIIPYKNSRNEGTFRTIILVDEEGTKIQATLFNNHIEAWKDFLKPNTSYYIANGRLDPVNPNYSSVHKDVELAFTDKTIITESDYAVSPQKFYDGFLSLDHVDKLPKGEILDLLCMLVTVNPIIETKYSKLREIVVTNELMDHTTVTLWGDFAENDGAILEKLKDDKPILGLCDVKVSMFKGTIGLSTIPVSSVLINPVFEKAMELRAWREDIKAEKKDITATPSKAMRRAIQVPLQNIMTGLLDDSQDCLYKFTGKVTDILNKDEPWYSSCKKCRRKVDVIQQTAACRNCNMENAEYEMRYCLRLEVFDGEQCARVVLFEAAKHLLGCNVQEYIESIAVKKEESHNYRKLVLLKDKQFTFLVRVDMNYSNQRRSLIAQEIHGMEAETPIIVEEETKPLRLRRKRLKKANDEPVLLDMNDPNPRSSQMGHEIHEMEAETPIIVEEETKPLRLRRKRVKKATAEPAQRNQKKIKAEKK